MDKTQFPLQALATEAARLMTAGQEAAVAVFEAEVRAIGALLEALPADDAAAEAARRQAEEEAVERSFDNMPI